MNWNRDVGNRPTLSSLAAGLGMTGAIREGYLRAHREVVVLPEQYTGANIFCRVADLTYDAQFYFVQADLLARHAPPAACTLTPPGAWVGDWRDELSGELVSVREGLSGRASVQMCTSARPDNPFTLQGGASVSWTGCVRS